ncbi:hypothetical protein FB45DRAFT_1008322 [Roridomyces roridus]|uniref:Uncharacterized protein n=1 Tax=Roridomyces roridus TaxID=1738132 RepID=A0AAD7FCB0_9AGAR|nr:hypothetical protein FB45DRAFT_1008322 [Roridomyces roridus]
MRFAQPKPSHGGTCSTIRRPSLPASEVIKAPRPAAPLWLERKLHAPRVRPLPPLKRSPLSQIAHTAGADIDRPPCTRPPTPATASHFNIRGSDAEYSGDWNSETENDPCTSPVAGDSRPSYFCFASDSNPEAECEKEDLDDDSLYLHKLALESFHTRQLQTGLETLEAEFNPAVDDGERFEELQNLARWRADQKINVIGREVPEEVGGLSRIYANVPHLEFRGPESARRRQTKASLRLADIQEPSPQDLECVRPTYVRRRPSDRRRRGICVAFPAGIPTMGTGSGTPEYSNRVIPSGLIEAKSKWTPGMVVLLASALLRCETPIGGFPVLENTFHALPHWSLALVFTPIQLHLVGIDTSCLDPRKDSHTPAGYPAHGSRFSKTTV